MNDMERNTSKLLKSVSRRERPLEITEAFVLEGRCSERQIAIDGLQLLTVNV